MAGVERWRSVRINEDGILRRYAVNPVEAKLRREGIYIHRVSMDLRLGGLIKWQFIFPVTSEPETVKALITRLIWYYFPTVAKESIAYFQRKESATDELPEQIIYWVQFKDKGEV